MKKTVSVVYTVFVVVILLGVIAYFGWDIYQSRAGRIADFESRTSEYTDRLADSLAEYRDVNAEVAIAEELMKNDPSLVAVQVYSHDDGLRVSVVKPPAGDYTRTPLADSGEFDGFFARIRYRTVVRPMKIPDMTGLEALYVSATLSGAEIRSSLLIILVTVVGLFVITLVMILIRPGGTATETETTEEFEDKLQDELDEFTAGPAPDQTDDDFSLPDFDETPAGLPEDLSFDDDSFSESIDFDMDDDFSLPDPEDFGVDTVPAAAGTGSPVITRLESELERAASFNQDLTLLVFSPDESAIDLIQETFNYEDLLFHLGDGRIAVIEINKDLDTTLGNTEDFVRDLITRLGNRRTRAGIASRNGRLIGAERLFSEALGALNRTDETKNIVAFRSDPEKYREYLRSQEN